MIYHVAVIATMVRCGFLNCYIQLLSYFPRYYHLSIVLLKGWLQTSDDNHLLLPSAPAIFMCGLSFSMANKQTTALIRHMGAGEQTNARLRRTELLQSVPCQPMWQKQEPRQSKYEVKYNNKVLMFQTVPQ